MSSTDELLKTAEKNLADAKQQYEHAQQSAEDEKSPLLAVMKANYENARRNLANVKQMAKLMAQPVGKAAVKETTKPPSATPVPKKKVDPNAVKLPGSAATIYFPTMDDFVSGKNNQAAQKASQWQADVIRKSSQQDEKADRKKKPVPPKKGAADDDQVTLTREQYRKQLKKKK